MSPNYLSDTKPSFKPTTIELGKIPAYRYRKTLKRELSAGTFTQQDAVNMLEDMLIVRGLRGF